MDIFEGVREEQALRMAANLGFKGPLQRQVIGLLKASKSQRKERPDTSTVCAHTKKHRQ